MPEIDIYILLAQIVNFWVLLAIFYFALWKKMSQKIQERRAQLEKLKKAEEHYDEKMILAEKQRQEIMENARKTSRNLLEESRILAKAKADAIMKEAHAWAMAVLEGGRREIEKERISMLTQMKSHIVDISLRMNEKMFWKEKVNQDFIEREFNKMK